MNKINNNDYLTVPEVANMLRIAEHTLRQYVYQKKIPYVKLTGTKGRVLFKKSTIEQWLEAKHRSYTRRNSLWIIRLN